MSNEEEFFWAQEKSESIRYQFIDKQVGFFYLFEIIHGQFEEFCHTSGSSKPPSLNCRKSH